jgi:hypothetical protein
LETKVAAINNELDKEADIEIELLEERDDRPKQTESEQIEDIFNSLVSETPNAYTT